MGRIRRQQDFGAHPACGAGRFWRSTLPFLLATPLLCGAASGQTVTGTLAEAADYFTFPDSSMPTGKGILFRLRVTDAPTLVLSFPEQLGFAHRFGLYRTLLDMAQQIPVDGVVETLVTDLSFLEDGVTLPFQVALTEGEDLTLVLECLAFCDDLSQPFAFDLIGAVRLSFGPDTAEELASLVAASSGMDRLAVLDAQRVAREMGALSLALRSAVAAGGPTVSTKGAEGGLVGTIHSWAQLTGLDSRADQGPGSMTGTGFQVGADVALGADMVAGLSLGHADLTATDGTTRQDGGLTWAQPYAAWNPGSWHGHASLIWGRGSYDQTSAAGTGSGETRLLALTLEGGFDQALGSGLVLTPSVGVITGRQTVTGTGGTLSGAGTTRVEFTQSSLGATLTYQRPAGTVFAGLHADYLDQDSGAVLTEGFLSEEGWTGRLAVGGSMELGSGLGLATSLDLGGLGGTAQTLSGGLHMSLRF
ncbi:MAG: autotransporter outer membrane beta-barrel domain-containing protein [Rhodobacterales bacterium]|nr:MAG: autotransporter outer membrane beta-barrel domain-containing protein [Rhodobacterales bacterium]